MSVARRALRDSAIIAAAHAGEKTRDIARDHDLSVAQVNAILRRFNAAPTPLDSAPMEILERALRVYRQQMRDFAHMAADTLDRAPAVAVAAQKGFADAFERYMLLLSQLGKLPDNLELFKREQEMHRFVEQLEERVHMAMAGDIELSELLAFLGGAERPTTVVGTYELEAGDE
jgi:Ribonuclease G/E